MPVSRISLPARPSRGGRIRRGVIAASAGALLLLGAACTGGAAEPPPEAESADSVAAIDTTTPAERPVLVAGAVSSAPAVDTAPPLPDWVTKRLEAEPPKLALNYPAQGTTFTESYVMFSGKAEPGSIVAAGPYETKADEHGQWNIGLVLSAGQNTATFSTISEEGVETRESVTVHYQGKDKNHSSGDGSKYNKKDHDGDFCPIKE